MHSVLRALVLTGYHMNGIQSIRDSSERNAKAQGCLCGTRVVHQLDLQKAKQVQSIQCLQRSESSNVASIPAEYEIMQEGCRHGCHEELYTQLILSDSFQVLLGKFQKDYIQEVPYPELAFFLSVQRVDLEGPPCRPKCWVGSGSSR